MSAASWFILTSEPRTLLSATWTNTTTTFVIKRRWTGPWRLARLEKVARWVRPWSDGFQHGVTFGPTLETPDA